MRTFLFAALIAIPLSAQAQWKQSFPGQNSLMRNICALNDQNVWAMDQTEAGISTSLNGGSTWTFKPMDATMKANYVGGFYAINDSTAFTVVANGTAKGTYKTTNRGQSWKMLTNGFDNCSTYPDLVYFFNDKDGVAIGDGSNSLCLEIMVTRDGGELWSLLPETRLPMNTDWTMASNNVFRPHGDTLYIMGGSGRIFKTMDKGLSWTAINTPLNNGQYCFFDFKDAQHGLLSVNNPSTKLVKLWSTSNGGLSWDSIHTTDYYSYLVYVPQLAAYFSCSAQLGLSYSKDDGKTWTKHPSFDKVGVDGLVRTKSGQLFMGGWGTIYSSTNPLGINPSVVSVSPEGNNKLNIQFSEAMDAVTSQDTSRYTVSYVEGSKLFKLNIKSAVQDITTPSLVKLTMDAALPLDTIRVNVHSVFDSKGREAGFPVINNSTSSVRTLLPTALAAASSPEIKLWVDKNATLQVSEAVDMDVLEVFDASGKQLVRQSFENKPVQLRSLKVGLYLIRLSGKEGVKTIEYLRN